MSLVVSRSCKHRQKRKRIKPKRCRFGDCQPALVGCAVVAPKTMTVRLWSCFQTVKRPWSCFGIIPYYLVFLLFVNLIAWSYPMISLASSQSASSFSDAIKPRETALCLGMKVWEGGENLVGVNVCLPCAPSIRLLSVAILAPCVSCSLSAESLLFGMVWFVYGHFELC